jgi:transcriptional regulator with XRE-family HTH domain
MREQQNRPSNEWYRKQIEQLGDSEVRTGPISPTDTDNQIQPPLTLAFSILVKLERRNKKLSVADLARVLQVEEEEVRRIEHDQSYRARPRTIIQFATHFGLPVTKIMKLAGATIANDHRFVAEVQRFAAYSDDLGALTSEERRTLNQFVEFLKDNA